MRRGWTRFAPKKEETNGRVAAEGVGVVLATVMGSLAMTDIEEPRAGGAAVSSLAND